jgi:hypothetical protein
VVYGPRFDLGSSPRALPKADYIIGFVPLEHVDELASVEAYRENRRLQPGNGRQSVDDRFRDVVRKFSIRSEAVDENTHCSKACRDTLCITHETAPFLVEKKPAGNLAGQSFADRSRRVAYSLAAFP